MNMKYDVICWYPNLYLGCISIDFILRRHTYFFNNFLTFEIQTISKWSNFITDFLLLAVLEQFFALDWTHDTGSACLAWCTRYCKNLIATLYVLIDLCLCFHYLLLYVFNKFNYYICVFFNLSVLQFLYMLICVYMF